MGLSFFSSSWDYIQLQDNLIPEMDTIFQPQQQQQQELATNMFGFNYEASPPCLDPFIEFEPFCSNTFNFSSSSDDFNFPIEDLTTSFHVAPKLQTCYVDDISYNKDYYFHFNSNYPKCFRPYASAPDILLPTPPVLPEFQGPDFSRVFENKRVDENNVGNNVKKRCLSAQSIAARERRRRIAEKTQELGKLIPGGQRMNTAEMFHAAAKYVKFLQAQVGVLHLIQTMQETKESMREQEHHRVLLASPAIQEKLSAEEVCLVPKKIVEELAADRTIQTSSKISKYLNKLLVMDP